MYVIHFYPQDSMAHILGVYDTEELAKKELERISNDEKCKRFGFYGDMSIEYIPMNTSFSIDQYGNIIFNNYD